MRRVYLLLAILIGVFLSSCAGDSGPADRRSGSPSGGGGSQGKSAFDWSGNIKMQAGNTFLEKYSFCGRASQHIELELYLSLLRGFVGREWRGLPDTAHRFLRIGVVQNCRWIRTVMMTIYASDDSREYMPKGRSVVEIEPLEVVRGGHCGDEFCIDYTENFIVVEGVFQDTHSEVATSLTNVGFLHRGVWGEPAERLGLQHRLHIESRRPSSVDRNRLKVTVRLGSNRGTIVATGDLFRSRYNYSQEKSISNRFLAMSHNTEVILKVFLALLFVLAVIGCVLLVSLPRNKNKK